MIQKYKKWLGRSVSKNEDIQHTEKVQLIEGTFNPIEAADVLLSLVSYKIKFHNLQLLHLDRNQKIAKDQSEKRIAELKDAKNKITQIIMECRDEGTSLLITSDIQIHRVPSKSSLQQNPETI